MDKKCKQCGKKIITNDKRRKLCGWECVSKWKSQNPNKGCFKKNHIPSTKGQRSGEYKGCQVCGKKFYSNPSRNIKYGKYCNQQCYGKFLSTQKNEKSLNWKGDKVGYGALHTWVKKNKPKSDNCEKCGKKTERLEAANISGKYKRELADYEWLCIRCHRIKDGNMPYLQKNSHYSRKNNR